MALPLAKAPRFSRSRAIAAQAREKTKGLEPQPTPVESGSLHLLKQKLPARD
jgi:hypothetical protein